MAIFIRARCRRLAVYGQIHLIPKINKTFIQHNLISLYNPNKAIIAIRI